MNFKILLLSFCISVPAFAKMKAVTTIPDLAWIIQELGGKEVDASALLSGKENPHYIDALPSYILKAADADLFCMVGLELEIGYVGPILTRSGNSKIQASSPSYCDASRQVKVLEKITGHVDRSMGDVHPSGNPHYYLSPTAMQAAASEIANIMIRMDQTKKGLLEKNLLSLKEKLSLIYKTSNEKLKSIDGSKPLIIEYHKEFSYFFEEYNLKSFGSIEEKPGVPPSKGRIGRIAADAKAAGVKVVLAADYNPPDVLKSFTEISGIPVVKVPTMVQPGTEFDTYDKVQARIVDSLLSVLGPKNVKP